MSKKTVFLLQGNKSQNEELAKMFTTTNEYEVCGMAEEGVSKTVSVKLS